MLETFEKINSAVNSFVWGIPAMVCIIGVGLLLMLVTGIGQMFDGEKNNRRTGEIYEYL